MKTNSTYLYSCIFTCLILCGPNATLKSEVLYDKPYLISGALGCLTGGLVTYALKDSITTWIKRYTAPRVACLSFEGPIHDVGQLVSTLIHLKENTSIDGVLFMISSGGGNPGQSEILHRTIQSLKEEKPVVVFVLDCCASGAYFAASAASQIVAPSVSTIGSIGAYSTRIKAYPEKYDDKETSGTLDVYEFVAGKYKQSAAPHQQLDEDNKKHQQEYIDSLYENFCHIVADARNLRLDETDEWAEGRIFVGNRAKHLNLIDEVGGFEVAVALIKLELKKRGKTKDNIAFVDFGGFSCHCA